MILSCAAHDKPNPQRMHIAAISALYNESVKIFDTTTRQSINICFHLFVLILNPMLILYHLHWSGGKE